MRAKSTVLGLVLTVFLASVAQAVYVSDGEWLKGVPDRDHARVNPFEGQADAMAAGERIYADHCSHCHGKQAEGSNKRPSLKSERIQHQASDGDLFWLLTNGNMKRGMPPWSKLPDQQRWQVIAYLKSLRG